MRITVSHVLEMLAGGMTPEEILQDFPYLEKADIDACLKYAARQAAHREILLRAGEVRNGSAARPGPSHVLNVPRAIAYPERQP